MYIYAHLYMYIYVYIYIYIYIYICICIYINMHAVTLNACFGDVRRYFRNSETFIYI